MALAALVLGRWGWCWGGGVGVVHAAGGLGVVALQARYDRGPPLFF